MVVVRSTRNTELGLQATLALLIGAPPAGCPPDCWTSGLFADLRECIWRV